MFECKEPDCGLSFDTLNKLKSHKRIHSNNTIININDIKYNIDRINGYFNCPICSGKFKDRSNLKRHVDQRCGQVNEVGKLNRSKETE